MTSLSEYTKNFQALVKKHKNLQNSCQDLNRLIEVLRNDGNTAKNNEILLKKQLKESFEKISNENLLSNHLELKDAYEIIINENDSLKQTINEIKAQYTNEIEESKNEFQKRYKDFADSQSEMLANVEKTYIKHIKELEEREQRLKETLHLAQSKSAMQFDLMETDLRHLLDESNKKVKDLENANSVLRGELFSLKNRKYYTDHINNEQKLNLLKNELKKAEDNLTNKTNNVIDKNLNDELEMSSINQRTDINLDRLNNCSSNQSELSNYPTLNITSSFGKKVNNENDFRRKFSRDKVKAYLPPLVQVTSTTFHKAENVKKRKLYDPNENPFCDS